MDLIKSIKEIVLTNEDELGEATLEVLKQIESNVKMNDKPKKRFLVA